MYGTRIRSYQRYLWRVRTHDKNEITLQRIEEENKRP